MSGLIEFVCVRNKLHEECRNDITDSRNNDDCFEIAILLHVAAKDGRASPTE